MLGNGVKRFTAHTDLNSTIVSAAFSSLMAHGLATFPLGLARGPNKGVFRPSSWTAKTVAPIASIAMPA